MPADVDNTPFRIAIPSGVSTFTIKVPHHYLRSTRKFFFNQLELAPDFFSLEAEKLKLDADPDLDQTVETSVQVKITYMEPRTVYAPVYQNASTTTKTIDFIEKINEHFEKHKPDYAYTTPFFFDWIDASLNEEKEPKKYVPLVAHSYYNEPYYAVLHSDRLPASVRELDGVNNFLPPIGTMEAQASYQARIRLRMWMAPVSKVTFSSNMPFVTDLGFSYEQLGQSVKNQYHIVNDKSYWLPVAVGVRAPNTTITKTDVRITVSAASTHLINRINKISVTKRDWLDDGKLYPHLSELFSQTSRYNNTIFSLGFNNAEKRYMFHFPVSDNVTVIISCQPELAMRLGFGAVTNIVRGMQAEPQMDRYSIYDAQKKALALVYDTGPLLCTLDQVSSNQTSGALDQFMAALYPHQSGILKMPQSVCSCAANAVHINAITQSSAAQVPITFRLLRIYDDEKVADFSWKNDAFIYGILQGICGQKV
jgi:hypothetical protein